MVNNFFDKKTGPGATSKTRANVTEVLVQELHTTMIKNSKKGKSMPGLKIIFGQQIQLKWDHYLLLIVVLNIYCVRQMFFPKSDWVKPLTNKKSKTVLDGFIGIVNKS